MRGYKMGGILPYAIPFLLPCLPASRFPCSNLVEMSKDYYAILGVDKKASTAEIKKAYRRLARKYHPDVNPGDKAAEEKFKAVSEASAVLTDPEKRRQYDRGEGSPFADGGPAPSYGRGVQVEEVPFDVSSLFSNAGGFEDLFSQMFGGRPGPSARPSAPPPPPAALTEEVTVEFKEAVLGGSVLMNVKRQKECSSCGGRGNKSGRVCSACHGSGVVVETEKVRVRIPAGVDTGSAIRMAGKGNPNPHGGPAGDLYLQITVKPHAYFHRRGDDIHAEVPLTVLEAYGGADVEIPTITGRVKVKVPPRTQSGQMFRLKGKGVPNLKSGVPGDHYYRVRVVLPDKESELAKDLIKRLSDYYSFPVRAGLPEEL